MTRYAVAAIPWTRVLPAACLVLVLMELVRRWPFGTWALQAAAVGLLAGAAAWSLDEPAARVVDTLPRSLAWRTAARLPVAVLLAGVWVLAVTLAWDSLHGHAREVLGQGFAALAIAVGWTSWRRAHGVPTPGVAFAVGVIPAALACALLRPVSGRILLFPYVAAPAEDWSRSEIGWTVVGGLAVVLLLAALADAPWWRTRRLLRSVHSGA